MFSLTHAGTWPAVSWLLQIKHPQGPKACQRDDLGEGRQKQNLTSVFGLWPFTTAKRNHLLHPKSATPCMLIRRIGTSLFVEGNYSPIGSSAMTPTWLQIGAKYKVYYRSHYKGNDIKPVSIDWPQAGRHISILKLNKQPFIMQVKQTTAVPANLWNL